MKQIQEPDLTFRKNDTVWWEPRDPIKARDPRIGKQAGWLGTVNYETGQALLLRYNEAREEYGQLVPIVELRHRPLHG
jgi:hypothetical protein